MGSAWALVGDSLVPRSKAQADIEDRGYQFGDGAYEVIRVYAGRLFRGEEHALRFERSLAELRIPFPDCRRRVLEGARRLVAAEGVEDGTVYLQITRGAAKRVHQFPAPAPEAVLTGTASHLPRPEAALREGVRILVVQDLRWLRNDIKSLNLLGSVLAKQSAKEAGCFEALLHRDGRVTEGASSNAFIVADGVLRTPPADTHILWGITRACVIALAKDAGIPVEEQPFTVEEFLGADEAFLTGTTTEVMPIVSADMGNGRPKAIGSGEAGTITRELQRRYGELIGP